METVQGVSFLSWGIFLLVILSMAFMGLVVYLRGRREKIHRLFAVLVLLIVIWSFSNFLENEQWLGHPLNAFFLRLDFALAPYLAYVWFLFCVNFRAPFRFARRWVGWSAVALAAYLAILSFTAGIIHSIRFEEGTIRFSMGPLFFVYAAFVAGFILAGLMALTYSAIKAPDSRKIQARYILAGFSLSAVLALVINLLLFDALPSWAARFGLYGLFVMVGVTAYSITRYRLFNLRVLTAEIVTGVLVITAFGQLFFAQSVIGFAARLFLFALVVAIGFILTRSVAREHESAERVRQLNKNLQDLMKTKTEFMQIASHQLRTPVSVIIGTLDMLREGGLDNLPPNRRQEFLKRAYLKAQKLNQVITDVLSATEMDVPRFDIGGTARPLDLRALAEQLVQVHQDEAAEKGLALTVDAPSPVAAVNGSEQYLTQALTNFISNAIKYTKQGSVTVRVRQEGDKVAVAVADTGIGIAKDDLARLWSKFVRGKNARDMYTDGTGLGLFIAKKIIEGHPGGQVFVESTLGRGSTFGFRLPIVKAG